MGFFSIKFYNREFSFPNRDKSHNVAGSYISKQNFVIYDKNANLTINNTVNIHTLIVISLRLPQSNLTAVYEIKPSAIPCAIENVSGVINSTTATGIASVISSQSTNFRFCNISTATYKIAPAVA